MKWIYLRLRRIARNALGLSQVAGKNPGTNMQNSVLEWRHRFSGGMSGCIVDFFHQKIHSSAFSGFVFCTFPCNCFPFRGTSKEPILRKLSPARDRSIYSKKFRKVRKKKDTSEKLTFDDGVEQSRQRDKFARNAESSRCQYHNSAAKAQLKGKRAERRDGGVRSVATHPALESLAGW